MSPEMESHDWLREFEKISKSTEVAASLLHGLAKRLLENVLSEEDVEGAGAPRELPEILHDLDEALRKIEKTNRELRDYFCSLPLRKLFTGLPMTREEFYLLAARGAITIPSPSGEDPYQEFMYFLYEDGERSGYIGLSENAPDLFVDTEEGGWESGAPMTFGVVPEDVDAGSLGSDQRAFFKKYRPDLYQRFHGV
jgi:hypothetical protein